MAAALLKLGTVVDVEALWQTAAAAMVGGLGIVFCFSAAIWGGTRATDFLNDDRRVAAAAAISVSVLGLLASCALAAAGIVAMVS